MAARAGVRAAFMGTPDFAVPTLDAMARAGHEIACVYTRAPAASGRGLRPKPSPVQAAAERLGLPVRAPGTLRNEAEQRRLASLGLDVVVVVAYGLLLPRAVLDAPRLGCLNLHASLLPRWRGAAPIQRAVMAGDNRTGVAVMRMEEGLDTGPVGPVREVEIGPDETAGRLADTLAELGAELMVEALRELGAGRLAFRPQPAEGATYARKITNDEAQIDWSRPALSVHNQVRGLAPFPGAFFGLAGERIKVRTTERANGSGPPGTLLDRDGLVACGEGVIRLLTLQRAGRGALPAPEVLRGLRLDPGAVLA